MPIVQCAGNGLTALKVVINVLRSCVVRTKLLNLQQDSYQRTQHCASALKYTPKLEEVMISTQPKHVCYFHSLFMKGGSEIGMCIVTYTMPPLHTFCILHCQPSCKTKSVCQQNYRLNFSYCIDKKLSFLQC